MPVKEFEPEKIYYSIGEVAGMFKVKTSLIRYWENEFDILRPKKNKKGNRLFTREDLENLKIIYHLIKERGFTHAGAKEKLRKNKTEVFETVELKNSLLRVRGFLTELRNSLKSPGDKTTGTGDGMKQQALFSEKSGVGELKK